MRRLVLAPCAFAIACSAPPQPEPVVIAPPRPPKQKPDPFHMTETSFGPITTTTVASLKSLREAVRGFDVRPVNDDDLQFMVSKHGEDLFYVIIDDPTGLVFNIHVITPRIRPPHRKWRAKTAFHGSGLLTDCECWGSAPMCFKAGDFVAVGFERECGNLDTKEQRRELEGQQIHRVVWSPNAFGDDNADDPPDPCSGNPCSGNPCGGNPCGP